MQSCTLAWLLFNVSLKRVLLYFHFVYIRLVFIRLVFLKSDSRLHFSEIFFCIFGPFFITTQSTHQIQRHRLITQNVLKEFRRRRRSFLSKLCANVSKQTSFWRENYFSWWYKHFKDSNTTDCSKRFGSYIFLKIFMINVIRQWIIITYFKR